MINMSRYNRVKSSVKFYGVLLLFAVILSYPILSWIICQTSTAWITTGQIMVEPRSSRPWQRITLSNISLGSTKPEVGEYPKDLFTATERANGAIVLHILGICYMFLALSIICDEFFVPALHVITDILAISDDVAGATFMAAGGSAPELFTSILGVFVAKTNIGFGTIVGSAVFNVLFVIAMCVIFSKSVLHLTWWPLLRDSLFYASALGLLIGFFSDSKIKWWESLALFAVYIIYVLFMYFNETVERNVKSFLAGLKKKDCKVSPQVDAASHRYRNGALQLVIHTLDPVSEDTAENKFHQIKSILQVEVQTRYRDPNDANVLVKEKYRFERESQKIIGDVEMKGDVNCDLRKKAMTNNYLVDTKEKLSVQQKHPQKSDSYETLSNSQYTYSNYGNTLDNRPESECSIFPHSNQSQCSQDEDSQAQRPDRVSVGSFQSNNLNNQPTETQKVEKIVRFSGRMSKMSCTSHVGVSLGCVSESANQEKQATFDLEDEPLSLAVPSSIQGKIWYIIKLPIVLLLFVTLPDVRKPTQRKFFPWTFLGSILWIGGFSYLMVWWASTTGDTLGIPSEVMGITLLAAGTSIPDLITSVLVAREGLGDMAVSSSIGSNIFDVTVGLPIPWFLWSAVNSFSPKTVHSNGLFCSTVLLFFMLLSVIASIAIFRWRMTKYLAAAMFVLYAIFLVITLLIELNVFGCFL